MPSATLAQPSIVIPPPLNQPRFDPTAPSSSSSYAARSAARTGTLPYETPTLSNHPEEQSGLLQRAVRNVVEASQGMNRAIDANDLSGVLEMACLLLEELGDPNHGVKSQGGTGVRSPTGTVVPSPPSYTSAGSAVPPLGNYGTPNTSTGRHNIIAPLSPKHYYELHMRAMDSLPPLEEFLLSSTDMDRLTEAVYWCPRVVPRIYLQICMGSVAIRAGAREAVEVMEELGEAAKCVQCPVRGLFLRYALLMALKDKLPDGEEEVVEENKEVIVPAYGGGLPTVPPPMMPPPPPPPMESSLLANSDLFPDREGDLISKPLFSEPVLGPSPLDYNNTIETTPKPADDGPDNQSIPLIPDTLDTAQPTNTGPRIGTVRDSYEFILHNLIEMNRLWIRIQHLPGDKSKETKRTRERERNDLRILVGSNLNRLSQLEGISAHTYGSRILPRILEEVASCKDALAQAYLMDCIIQVFPDEFHLETLEVLLGVLPRLRDKVNVRTILNNMMERLLHYYQDETLVDGEVDTNDVKRTMAIHSFDMFEECVSRVFEARGMNIAPKDVIRLESALLGYTMKISPGNLDHISRCIGRCAQQLRTLQEQKRASMVGQGIVVGGVTKRSMELEMDEVAISELENLLSVPLDQIALKVLDMPQFSSLLAFLPWENRRKVSISMLKGVLSRGDDARVKDTAEEEQLFEILAPLLRDEGCAPSVMYENRMEEGGSLISRTANLMSTLGIASSGMPTDPFYSGGVTHSNRVGDPVKHAQFHEEQILVAKVIHALEHDDTDVTYQMLNIARKHIQPGGAERVTVTMPALVFSALRLLRRVQRLEFVKLGEDSGMDASKQADGDDAGKSQETRVESVETNSGEADGHVGNDDELAATAAEASQNNLSNTNEAETARDGTIGDVFIEENGREGADARNTVVLENDDNVSTPAAPLFNEFSKSVNCRKILVFLQKSVAAFAPNNPELAFKLYLEIAATTDFLALSIAPIDKNASVEYSGIVYDFLTQAFLVYEGEISDSKAQVRSITAIVGSLLTCKTFERSDYESLITKTAQYAAKLLMKADQCRMVCLCSRLFYVEGDDVSDTGVAPLIVSCLSEPHYSSVISNKNPNLYRNPQRVLECLQRALKIADACSLASSSNLSLFVEILDYYVYYYDIGTPSITDKFVSGLIALIKEHFGGIELPSPAVEDAKSYYLEVIRGISRKKKEKESAERFGAIVC